MAPVHAVDFPRTPRPDEKPGGPKPGRVLFFPFFSPLCPPWTLWETADLL